MKEQYLYRQAGEKKSKKRLFRLLLMICCNVLLLGFATTLSYSAPPLENQPIMEKSLDLASPAMASEDIGTRRQGRPNYARSANGKRKNGNILERGTEEKTCPASSFRGWTSERPYIGKKV